MLRQNLDQMNTVTSMTVLLRTPQAAALKGQLLTESFLPPSKNLLFSLPPKLCIQLSVMSCRHRVYFCKKSLFLYNVSPITFCGGQWRRKLLCWLRVDGKNNQLLAFIAPEGKYLILTSPQIWPNISSSMKAAFPGVFTIYVNCFCRKMIKCWEPEHKNELLLNWAKRIINL